MSALGSGTESSRARGDYGEAAVCRYLKRRGYRILRRNFTVKGGEIDIIAARFRYIVFVEVKTRKAETDTARFGHPADAINAEKIAHLRYAATRYLAMQPTARKPRFDVAEVYVKTKGKKTATTIVYRKEAF